MPESLLDLTEREPPDATQYECVEIYLPKVLKHLSVLYGFLRSKITRRTGYLVLDGFSVYEVDGAFLGANNRIWEERTLVVRVLFSRSADEQQSLRERITALGNEIVAKVARTEEEVWICHYPQSVKIFRPND